MPFLGYVSFILRVDKYCAFFLCFIYGRDEGQYFILHFYLVLCPICMVAGICHYKGHRVSEKAGGFPDSYHGFPVFYYVAHSLFSRNILGCEYGDYALFLKGLFLIQGQKLCPRIFGTKGHCMEHAVYI